jgi:uncharacterized protein with PIN domain
LKPYTKLYLDHFGYDIEDFIACEVCSARAVDIHHIEARGMGGTSKDSIENIMALCRKCHIEYGDKKQHKEMLIKFHSKKLKYGIAN